MTNAEETQKTPEDGKKDWILVYTGAGDQIRVFLKDTLYLKADGGYTKVITAKGEYLKTCQFGLLLKRPGLDIFLRVHKSFAVNKDKVEGTHNGCVLMAGREITIGRTYKAIFDDWFGGL